MELWKHDEGKTSLNKPFLGRQEVVYTLEELVSAQGGVKKKLKVGWKIVLPELVCTINLFRYYDSIVIMRIIV